MYGLCTSCRFNKSVGDKALSAVQCCNTRIQADLPAQLTDLLRRALPHLSGTIGWIEVLFNERCLNTLTAQRSPPDDLFYGMAEHFRNREAFHALRAPLCR